MSFIEHAPQAGLAVLLYFVFQILFVNIARLAGVDVLKLDERQIRPVVFGITSLSIFLAVICVQ